MLREHPMQKNIKRERMHSSCRAKPRCFKLALKQSRIAVSLGKTSLDVIGEYVNLASGNV